MKIRFNLFYFYILALVGSFFAHQNYSFSGELTAVAGIPKPMKNWRPNTSRKIQLSGSRGETLNFLLHFPVTQIPSEGCLTFSLNTYGNMYGNTNESQKIESAQSLENLVSKFYFLPPVMIDQPSFVNGEKGLYYDPAIPLEDHKICSTTIKGATNLQQEGVWILGELIISEEKTVGNYPLWLEMTAPQTSRNNETVNFQSVDIDLTVWKLSMEKVPVLPMYTEFSSFWAATGHYGRNIENEGLLAKNYISEMVKHNMVPLKGWLARPPVITDSTTGLPIYDLKNYPTSDTSFESLYIQQIPGKLYIDFPKEKFDMRPDERELHWQTLQRTLQGMGIQNRSLIYLGDEPRHDWELEELIQQSNRIRSAMPETKIYIKTKYYEVLKNSASIWAPILHPFSYTDINTAFDLYRALQRQGQEFWSYVSCASHGCSEEQDSGAPDFVIDRSASYIRSLAWLARWYKMDALTYHHSVFGYQFYPARDPWVNLFDQTGNGDGTLFYPGRPGIYGLKTHQPVPSLRLKIWREASYDAQYIQWVQVSNTKPEGWENKFYYLVRNMIQWNRDYYSYQTLRNQMGEFLNTQTLH